MIVPIFDGVGAMSKTMKAWLVANFPGIIDDLEDGPSGPGKIDARVYCSKWWYYADDVMPLATDDNQQARQSSQGSGHSHSYNNRANSKENQAAYNPARTGQVDDELLSRLTVNHRTLNQDGSFRASFQSNGMFSANFTSDNMSYFHMVPIVKRQNHRKHNSHQWFFDSICQALDQRVSYAFLTDCGTTYNSTCLARLLYELYFKTDLIGVTARQRVETPNLYFHPCEDAPYAWMTGNHDVDARPCWRCYLTFLCSPCPLQGFEFEATLIMNSAMFNLVEALPVMPGPCQLLHWQKMKKFKVVDEYFNLLFKGEAEKKLPRLPKKFKRMKSGKEEQQVRYGTAVCMIISFTYNYLFCCNESNDGQKVDDDRIDRLHATVIPHIQYGTLAN